MGTRTAVYLNDYDLAGLGFILEAVEGWNDAPSVRDRVTQLPGRPGTIALAPEAETAPRALSFRGVIRATSLAGVRTSMAALQERLYRGTVEVRLSDDPDKVFFARTEEQVRIVTPPQFASPHTRLSWRMTCPDPLRYDRNGTVIGFSSARGATPLGSAPSLPVLRIMGAATNPVITYRNAAGESIGTMGFTITLAATDYLEIDCELMTVTKVVSGVATSVPTILTSGDFLLLDPQDGSYPDSVWPTLEVSAGTGEALYRKAWL